MTRPALALLAALCAPAAVRADVPLPTGGSLSRVDFERHVMGLLSKTGCNAGSCHGSFQGRNGFRLSLFGYEPAFDHAALTRDNLGRRLDRVRPDNSLLLTKATGSTAHDGGMRFGPDSWAYHVFREWVRTGARWTPGSGTVSKLAVAPADFALVPAGQTLQLKVTATFADGTAEDVTPFCDFKVSDDAVAAVSATGAVTAARPGDAGLTVLYRGTVGAVRVLVPAPPRPGGYPDVPAANSVDREVFAKLKLLNMVPSDAASDETFLRRITIDTIAQLPTPNEVRAFVADADPKKREKLVDRLLAHPLHAAVWATKLSDITGNNTEALERPTALQPRRSQLWHDWLRKRIADNVPYDRIVRDVLTATSRDGLSAADYVAFVNRVDAGLDPTAGSGSNRANGGTGFGSGYAAKKTLDLFWRRQAQVPVEIWGEKVAAAFLGVRLECAQCHKHPTDRWTQDDYWAFANVFSQLQLSTNGFSGKDVKAAVEKENEARKARFAGKQPGNLNLVRELYVMDKGLGKQKPNPATGAVPTPRALGGPALTHTPGTDTRAKLADWLTAKDNPFFARSFVNRVWAHYFGVGLVNPVDDFSVANPPTNPRLLDALAKDFADNGYDLRRLERAILVSRTYGLSYDDNASNKFDRNNFSHAYVRPLMAEQVVDVLNAALGVDEKFGGADQAPAGTRMMEVGASKLNSPNLTYVLRVFGRPPRTTACDCERAAEPALPQSLFRMTDPSLLAKFNDPKGRAVALGKSTKAADELADELFLATLSRRPTAQERADAVAHLQGGRRTEAVTELMWALINTREFILNH